MTKVANELHQAVHQLFEISNTTSGNNNTTTATGATKARQHGNTYERKRCLRRIERAIISFQNQITLAYNNNNNNNDDDDDNDDGTSTMSPAALSDDTIEILMDILTEFPKLEFSKSDALRDLHDSITGSACSLIQQYALIPLSAIHMDRLLDRIATLALRGQRVDMDILQLINASLLQQHCEHVNMNTNVNDNVNTNDNINDNINGNAAGLESEPESNHYHSYMNIQGACMQNDNDPEIDCKHAENDYHPNIDGDIDCDYDCNAGGEQPLPTTTDDYDTPPPSSPPPPPPRGSIILDANETLRLTQILIPLSLKHLSQSWSFQVRDDDDDNDNNEGEGDDEKGAYGYEDFGKRNNGHCQDQNQCISTKNQHCGLQLRVLLSYLLRHFLSEVNKIDIDVNTSSLLLDEDEFGVGEDDLSSPMDKLQHVLFHLFQQQISDTTRINDGRDDADCTSNALAMVEDYIDLITSFLVENIEYAIDAIDTSSHYLDQQLHVSKGDHDGNGGAGNYVGTEYDIGSTTLTHGYVKDTVRLTSLAIGMIELFQEDLGLSWDTYKSHAFKLLDEFAPFVAIYCTNGVLRYADGANVTIDSGDKALMELWSIMRGSTDTEGCMGAGVCLGDRDRDPQPLAGNSILEAASFGSKRRRILPNEHIEGTKLGVSLSMSARGLDKTMVTTLLRAFSTNPSSEAALDVIQTEVAVAKEKLFHSSTQIEGVCESSASANQFASLLQACALSTLIMPQEECYEHEENHEIESLGFNGGLFSTLVDPLVSVIYVEDGDDDNRTTEPVHCMVDAMNPWNYFLSRNLSAKLSLMVGEDPESSLPMRVVTTSSVSSVSDIRSHNTSSTGKRKRSKQGECVQQNISSMTDHLAWFSHAAEPVNTL